MEIWKRNLLVLWIGVFFTSASFNMVIPFLPIFLIELNVHENTEIWAGVLFSAAFLPGRLLLRFGEDLPINMAENR